MQNIHPKTPTQVNYRILDLIQQMVAAAPRGTALGLCDLISAMLSGYFIESGGAVMPAVEAFLYQEIKDERERAARSRRAAKALTYGNYNLKELLDKLQEIDPSTIASPCHAVLAKASHFCHKVEAWDVGLQPPRGFNSQETEG